MTDPALERFPAKWIPVRRQKTRQSKERERRSDSIRANSALETLPADLLAYGEARTAGPSGSTRRIMFRLLGAVAIGFGVAGVFLPLLPTTPFLLVAAWAFARSSPRLEAWLRGHPRLGAPIAAWEARRAVPRPAKAVAVLGMAASVGLMAGIGVQPAALAVATAVLVSLALWLCSRPS